MGVGFFNVQKVCAHISHEAYCVRDNPWLQLGWLAALWKHEHMQQPTQAMLVLFTIAQSCCRDNTGNKIVLCKWVLWALGK